MTINNWTFKVFISRRRVNEIERWMSRLPINAQVKIDQRINYLKTQKTWTANDCKKLVSHKDIFELRISCQNVEYRPLGCYGPDRHDFTLLVGAIEKGGRFIPFTAPQIAKERRVLVFRDRRYINEY